MEIDLIQQELEKWVRDGCPPVQARSPLGSHTTITARGHDGINLKSNYPITEGASNAVGTNAGRSWGLSHLFSKMSWRVRFLIAVLSFYTAIGFLTWEFCPINPVSTIWLFVLSTFFMYLLVGDFKPIRVLAGLTVLLAIADVFGVATWHDTMVRTYASAM